MLRTDESANPPLRLLVGVGALKEARNKIIESQKDIDNSEKTTVGADFSKDKIMNAAIFSYKNCMHKS